MLRNYTIDSAQSMGGSLNGTAVPVDKAFDGFALQAVISSAVSPVGSLKVQASLDQVKEGANVTNWADIPDTVTAVSAAGTVIWHFDKCHYKWVRIVYTRTSGSATLDTSVNEND